MVWPRAGLLAARLLCVHRACESILICGTQVLTACVLEGSLVVTRFHDNGTPLRLRGYWFARLGFFPVREMDSCHCRVLPPRRKTSNKAGAIRCPSSAFWAAVPSLNDAWPGLSSSVSCVRSLSACFTSLTVKLRLKHSLNHRLLQFFKTRVLGEVRCSLSLCVVDELGFPPLSSPLQIRAALCWDLCSLLLQHRSGDRLLDLQRYKIMTVTLSPSCCVTLTRP